MKKNFRRIPDYIQEKVNGFNNEDFIVASVHTVNKNSFDLERYENLNLQIIDGIVEFPPQFIPDETTGAYSRKNINGYRVRHRDQEKIRKRYYLGERPVWGDWNKGSFSLYVTKLVFPYDEIPPREWAINIELLDETENEITIRTEVELTLNRGAEGWEEELFFAINLLQENVFSVDVYNATDTREDYLNNLRLTWEIFPPGDRDTDILRIIDNRTNRAIENTEHVDHVRRSYDFFLSLSENIDVITGISGMRRYFGVKYSDTLVVFENLEYGHAIYILFENWEELSRLSRTEIQQRPADQYIRIKHCEGWEDKVRRIINARIN